MDQPIERSGRNHVDLIGGAVMLAICTGFAWTAWGYGIGSPARMGAGFFPFWFGVVGIGIAIAVMVMEDAHLRPLLLVAASIVAFGLLIETAGLGPAVFAAAFLSAFADDESTLRQAVLLSLILAASIWVVFVYLLGLNMPLFVGLG